MADDLAGLFTRLHVCFPDEKLIGYRWNDAKCILECLKMKVKDSNNRAKISLPQINQTKQVLQSCLQLLRDKVMEVDEVLGDCVTTATELFRFLRNTAAGVALNQENIMSSGIIEQVNDITSILIKPAYQESCINDKVNDAVKSAIQLLGNMVVGNELTQEYVWRQCFPDFFLQVMTSVNYEIQNFMCMVIYNCLSSQRKQNVVSSQKGLNIMSQVLHLCADHDNLEWGYFILETFVTNGHIADIYQGLEFDPSARIILLNLIQVHLAGERTGEMPSQNQTDKLTSCVISEDSLIFLSQEFERESKSVFREEEIDCHFADNMMNAVLISRLLRLLSTATAFHTSSLQNHHQLLHTALDILHQTNNPIYREQFSNVKSAPKSQDSGELTPSHGFKRDLVRLIGNMCYKHRSNQDMVREKEGIPLIMDHCNIDDHNPYICQWAVFTLRNLLQDNHENQQIVALLDKRGDTDMSRLQQFGIDIKKTDDGEVRLVRKE